MNLFWMYFGNPFLEGHSLKTFVLFKCQKMSRKKTEDFIHLVIVGILQLMCKNEIKKMQDFCYIAYFLFIYDRTFQWSIISIKPLKE